MHNLWDEFQPEWAWRLLQVHISQMSKEVDVSFHKEHGKRAGF